MIKKGSIVWYWNKEAKDWRKGKVLAVNKYPVCYLTIKMRNGKGITHNSALAVCTPASEPKPTHEPYTSYTQAYADRAKQYELSRSKSYRLLKTMGIIQ